jgi:hypothetical protein
MLQLGGNICASEFGIPLKLGSLIKICLNGTYINVYIDKNFPEVFPFQSGLIGDAFNTVGFQICFKPLKLSGNYMYSFL